MDTTLYHLILAVEAQFTFISIAGQAVEQKCVVWETLEPEWEPIDIALAAKKVGKEEIGVDHGEARRESCSTHINLVLNAIKLSF